MPRARTSEQSCEPIAVPYWDPAACVTADPWNERLPAVLIQGKRYTGKDITLVDISQQLLLSGGFENALLFDGTDTDDMCGIRRVVKEYCRYTEARAPVLAKLIQHQRELFARHRGDPHVNPRLLVVFNDVLTRAAFDTHEFQCLLKHGGKMGILLVIAGQCFNNWPAFVRQNVGIVLTANELCKSVRRRMYRAWFSVIPDAQHMHDMLEYYTKNHSFFVAKLNHASDRLAWYQAASTSVDARFEFPCPSAPILEPTMSVPRVRPPASAPAHPSTGTGAGALHAPVQVAQVAHVAHVAPPVRPLPPVAAGVVEQPRVDASEPAPPGGGHHAKRWSARLARKRTRSATLPTCLPMGGEAGQPIDGEADQPSTSPSKRPRSSGASW